MEADYNLRIGIWFRRVIHQAEDKIQLGEMQYGSRPRRAAIDVVLTKTMTYDLQELTKTNGGTFDNDAKACYDRIVVNLAMLCARQLGPPEHACKVTGSMLEKARYKIKTDLGISDEEYTRTEENMLHGVLQGGKASSFIWVIVSCLIMDIMKNSCNGITFIDPRLRMESNRIMDGFVDDTTVWANQFREHAQSSSTTKFKEYDPKILAQALQKEAQTWERLLHSTGGELELTKCFYYIAHWKWNPDGTARLALPKERGGKIISITNSATGQEVKIEHTSCEESHRTLGVMKQPGKESHSELKRITEKTKNSQDRSQQPTSQDMMPR